MNASIRPCMYKQFRCRCQCLNVYFTSDKIKTKQKKGKKSKKAADELEEMEDEKIQYDDEILDYDKDINFDDMNLSRPLLKVSTCLVVVY